MSVVIDFDTCAHCQKKLPSLAKVRFNVKTADIQYVMYIKFMHLSSSHAFVCKIFFTLSDVVYMRLQKTVQSILQLHFKDEKTKGVYTG